MMGIAVQRSTQEKMGKMFSLFNETLPQSFFVSHRAF